ncbi:MAG: rRNA maturation RNase YbeY [Candidatus Pacebacteria bacterium]|nr:rRNA maturation RNase YbeY [Candidatus Paceibacterota bacterium]
MVEVNNLTRVKIDKNFLKKAAKKVLKSEKKNIELSIVLVEEDEIHKLNKKYRKKDCPTDVLSFLYSNKSGEIVICPKAVKENAKKFGSAFKKELTQVLIHGILHLLGYDHEAGKKEKEKMLGKERYYLAKFPARNASPARNAVSTAGWHSDAGG